MDIASNNMADISLYRLFITAHDAMHGAVFPQNHKINNLVGSIVLLWAVFHEQLLKKHWQHHHHPASESILISTTTSTKLFAWYFHFMVGYWVGQDLFA